MDLLKLEFWGMAIWKYPILLIGLLILGLIMRVYYMLLTNKMYGSLKEK